MDTQVLVLYSPMSTILVTDINKGILGSDVTGLLLGLQYVLALHGLGLLEVVGVYPAHLVPLLHVVRNN